MNGPVASPSSEGTRVSGTEGVHGSNGTDDVVINRLALTCNMAASATTERGTETGVGLGIALGAGIGVAMDDLPVGIALGFVLGAAIGCAWEQRQE